MSSESALSYLHAIWRWRLLWNGDKIDENGSLILAFVYIEEVFFTYEEVFFAYEEVVFTDWGGGFYRLRRCSFVYVLNQNPGTCHIYYLYIIWGGISLWASI